jgi:hypothetical protein
VGASIVHPQVAFSSKAPIAPLQYRAYDSRF